MKHLRNLCCWVAKGWRPAGMIGFSQTHNQDSLPWPRLETLTSVKQYLAFLIRRSGRAFTMVTCISAVLEGNAACHLLKLNYPQTFRLLKPLISSHKTPEEVWKVLPYASLTQHLPGDSISQVPSPQRWDTFLLFIYFRNILACVLCNNVRAPGDTAEDETDTDVFRLEFTL